METRPTTHYLMSDLHIGGDGGLDQCAFEAELIAFLAEIASGPQPAELIIAGDAFGFWELTDREGASKLATIAATHPNLFRQLRETGSRVTITLLPGNHDYDLACVPDYRAELALRIRYRVIAKEPPRDLTWLERLLIIGRRSQPLAPIPDEARVDRVAADTTAGDRSIPGS